MHETLSESAKQVISLAAGQARALNHGYVGTEHILLGLLLEGSCEAAGRLSLNSSSVRSEIESLTPRGPRLTPPHELPLTPRAKRVIELAWEEAISVSLPQVEPEHLLIGLIREPDGVAGHVMRNHGLQPDRVRAEALKIRMLQLRIVERAVRPVRAGITQKRKMREELLAHLTEIYQDESTRTGNPLIAMEVAASRFGDPAKLSRELQNAVPVWARIVYHVSRWTSWSAPESVLRMLMRTSTISFLTIVISIGVPLLIRLILKGWDQRQSMWLREFWTFLVLAPAAQFAISLCYFKIRDWMWGAFGARRSRVRVVLWTALAAVVVGLAATGFVASVEGTAAHVVTSLPALSVIAIFAAIIVLLLARARGQTEIRDTIWATLDLGAVHQSHVDI